MKSKFVVTGGAGFIGSHIVEALANEGSEVVVIDNLRTGNIVKLNNIEHTFINGDIRDLDCLISAFKNADTVFHLAAALSVPESMGKPVEYNDINVNGTLNVIKAAHQCNVRRIVFSSSAAVYGDNPKLPKVEAMTPEPLSPYAVNKLDGEYYLKLFAAEKFSAVVLRYFNVFGPRQDPDSAYAAAVPIFIHHALRNKDINIYGDGRQTRDFVYVKDIVGANLHARTAPSGIYNVGNDSITVIQTLAEKIVTMTNSESKIINVPERPGEVKDSRASIEKIISTGWKPSHSFDEALLKTIEYYK